MLKKLLQYYQIFCNLSLDVVFGVICCMLPLPVVFKITMPVNWYIVLPLSTWVIYLADHVIDVTRKQQEYPSPRHQFVKRNLRVIVALIFCISVVIAWQVLHPFSVLLFITGCIMAACVAIHLLIVRINPLKHSFINNKELAIAGIYASGIYAGPLMLLWQNGSPLLIPLFCGILLLVITFINLLMVSIIELKWDEEMDNASWVRIIGIISSTRLLYGVIIGSLVLGIILLAQSTYPLSALLFIYLIMSAGHFLIFKTQRSLHNHLWYRKLGEALFWLPLIVFFLG